MKNLDYIKASLLVVPLLMISACGDDPENEGNHLPTVSIDERVQTVNTGDRAMVSAKAIDVDGDSLTYLWRIKSKPDGSEAELSNSRTKRVSLVTDEDGAYVLSFVANDGLTDSETVTATVYASGGDPVVPDEQEETSEADKDDGDINNNVISNKTGIVSAWTIDKEKADAVLQSYDENDIKGLLVGLVIIGMKDLRFKEDGTCAIPGLAKQYDNKKCWGADGDNYIFYGDKGEKSATIEIDSDILIMNFEESENTKAMKLEYSRVDEATLVPPSVVMKKDRVYHAKNVQGDSFLMFIEEDEYYKLWSDGFSSFTVSELKKVIEKDKSDEGGFLLEQGTYSVDSGKYYVKNNAFHTFMEEKKIEIITQEHIKYDGDDYYLE